MLLCFLLRARISQMSMLFFFLMIRRPPRSTLDRSSAASDVYKRQVFFKAKDADALTSAFEEFTNRKLKAKEKPSVLEPVSYTHLRAHETVLDLVCRLLLEKKKKSTQNNIVLSLQSRKIKLSK